MRPRTSSCTLLALALAVGGGCGEEIAAVDCEERPEAPVCQTGEPPEDDEDKKPARLYVDPPFGVGFDCVAPGCDESRTMTLENRGDDPVKITMVRLSVDTTSEMTLELMRIDPAHEDDVLPVFEPVDFPSPEAPLVLSPGETVDAVVTYRPVDAVEDEGALWVDWFDGSVEQAEAVIERVEMPVTTRVLGDPEAELLTPELEFGYVPVGQAETLTVDVQNTSNGSAVLALEPGTISSPGGTFRLLQEDTVFVGPGQTVSLLVRFIPNANTAFFGSLTIPTNDGARPALSVQLTGTAIEQPFFEIVEPEQWKVDFDDVRIGETRTRDVTIRNLGGLPLVVIPNMSFGQEQGFSSDVTWGTSLPAVLPLSETTFTVTLGPQVGGELAGEITFQTNDPTLPFDWVDLEGFGVAPDAALSSDVLDFGQLVQSWTSPAQTLTIGNQGTGEMTIDAIEFEVGSSSQVHFVDLPQMPLKITGDDTVEVSVYVEGQTIGPANAGILIHTDSIEEPTRRVQVVAEVVGCDEGCPMAGGTPSCASGSCQVGVCFEGLHDADQSFSTGCECGEDPGGDVGDGCFDGADVGPLGDDGQGDYQNSTSRSGTLHDVDDEDLYYFFAVDGGGLSDAFGDSFRLKVELVGAPPGLTFCYRHANDGCGGQNQRSCGWTSREFADGSYGQGDDTWATIWVQWAEGAAPMCGNYTITFRADAG